MRRLWDKEKSVRLISLSPYLIIPLTVLLATWKLAFADRIIARGDLLLYFYPLREYASQAIREGRLPLWNPYTFMGAPFLANSQVGFFYPFNVLLAWLPVEKQVSVSIVLHLIIATLGMYALSVAGLRVGRLAGLTAAISFGLGGYLGAQVEHLNQLQVLSWLPLEVLIVLHVVSCVGQQATNARRNTQYVLSLSLLIALQAFAGHTQSLYICLVTLSIVILTQLIPQLWQHRRSSSPHPLISFFPLLLLGLSGILAALICAVQLLPTLELSRESYRSGGLSFGEAAAFSWRPWVIARALLPTYGDPLFPEYVAYFGVAGLALAVLGVMPERLEIRDWRLNAQSPISNLQSPKLIACILVSVGFILALGVVTPVFNVLYKFLPGFSLFRAQARWLVVFALGMSMLIGQGTQALLNGPSITTKRNWLLAWGVLIGLVLIGLLVGVRISPEAEYATLPARRVWLSWVATAACVTSLVIGYWLLPIPNPSTSSGRNPQSPIPKFAYAMLPLLLLIELFAASQFQPYSRAADRQALTSLRPSTAHLLAGQALTPGPSPGGEGRVLALSGLFFDPGDLPEQTLIYGKQLNKDELYDRVIASKHKEILSPNLSLYYGLPSVDGYDGGLLPTRRFVQFASQFTPTPKTGALDGRLREFLKAVPEDKWLAQMGVQYIIADKTADVFVDGVYYDLFTQMPLGQQADVELSEPYSATTLGLVLSGTLPTQPFQVIVEFADGTRAATLEVQPAQFKPYQSYWHLKLNWSTHAQAHGVRFRNVPTPLTLMGLTLIDATDNSFMPQQPQSTLAKLRLTYSGDVKIYENRAAAPRAYWADGMPASLIVDEPEHIVIANPLNKIGELTLRDACYPGWVARMDGIETLIDCTDILFRKVALPKAAKEIVFTYEPRPFRMGIFVSIAGLLLWFALATVSFIKRAGMLICL